MTFEEWWAYQERVPYWLNVEKRQARDVWRVAIEEAAKLAENEVMAAPDEIALMIRRHITAGE